MFNAEPKPSLWAFDPAAVDPQWYDFWGSCVACVPAWEGLSNQIPPAILGSSIGSANYKPQFCGQTSSPVWGISPHGPALFNPFGGNSTWQIPPDATGASPPDICPTTSITVLFVRQKLTSVINGSSFGLGIAGTPSAATRCGGGMPDSDGVVRWYFGGTTSPNLLTWSGYVNSLAVETWAFVAGKQGSAIYFNGIKRASQTTAISRSKTISGGVSDFGFTMGNSNGSGDRTNILFVAILNTEWTAGQVAEWSEDPYAPIRMSIDASTPPLPPAPMGMQSIIYM